MVKVKDLFKSGIEELLKCGIDSPKTDARVILEYVLGIDSGKLPLYYEDEPKSEKAELYSSLIKKRANHQPLSYITKKKEFMSLDFYVEEGVLIPRCETENLCEYCIEKINQKKQKVRVADICSGSGCIGLSVAKYCENSELDLYDISDDAIKVSEINKKNLGIANAQIYKKDILNEDIAASYDVIISNPPYIHSEDMPILMEEVRDYEPHIALTDGKDGMSFYKKLAEIASTNLKKGGFMAVEVGINMFSDVKNIFEKHGETQVIYDDFGIERIVVLFKE